MRFENSSNEEILPILKNRLQYLLPENLIPMISALFERNLKQDARFQGYSPQIAKLKSAVAEMIKLNKETPDWFLLTHHRSMRPERKIKKIDFANEKLIKKEILTEEPFENNYTDVTASTVLLTSDKISENDKNFNKKENTIKQNNNIVKNNEESTIETSLYKNHQNKKTINELLPLINNQNSKVEIFQDKGFINTNKLLPIQKEDTINDFDNRGIQTDSGIFETTTQDHSEPLKTPNNLPNGLIHQQNLTNEPFLNKQEFNSKIIKKSSFKNNKDNNLDSGMITGSGLQAHYMVSAS